MSVAKNGCFYCILQKKRTWNHEQTICFSIPIGNYQTVEVHRLSACSRENAANNELYCTVLYSILPLKTADRPCAVTSSNTEIYGKCAILSGKILYNTVYIVEFIICCVLSTASRKSMNLNSLVVPNWN